jgi:hypothetical protein
MKRKFRVRVLLVQHRVQWRVIVNMKIKIEIPGNMGNLLII